MANKKINITHPKLYKVTKVGEKAETYDLGEQEVEVKLADKLIARGVATDPAAEAKAKAEAKKAK